MRVFIILFAIIILTSCSAAEVDDLGLADDEIAAAAPRPEGEDVIGYAVTRIYDVEANRVSNLATCIAAADKAVLPKGEEFSFNNTTGERTEDKGYLSATALWGKNKTKMVGGGVCQVSTTIYQAAVDAGLDILERHSHKRKIDYAELGDDAAVDYGTLDLRFKNNTDNDILIAVSKDEKYIYVTLHKR